jgi:ATP-dependent RNA helicase RhlE
MKFKDLNLDDRINNALKVKGYTKPTPIQEESIPYLLEGSDLLGIAQTGTGKTAAFSLPIINHIFKEPKRMKSKKVRVLILTPTRELASQIDENIKDYSANQLKTKVIFGGVGSKAQINALRGGLDIVVATPGRLLDLLNEKHLSFTELETFVLDEADRMLDMGFIHDIKKIITFLPAKRQNLLFSATMPKDIEKLARTILVKPKKVEVTPESSTVDKINQSVNFMTKENKFKRLVDILKGSEVKSALVFTRTKHGADQVVRKLMNGNVSAKAIHGNKSQNNRENALKKFRSGEVKALVATDIAARGIDVDIVTHVINFNLPEDPKSYVHRIGRTARAGREGVAISLCDAHEISLLKGIEKHIKLKIDVDLEQEYHEELKELPTRAQLKNQQQRSRPPRNKRSENKTKASKVRRPRARRLKKRTDS